MSLSLGAKGLIGAFGLSGAIHLVHPQTFEVIVPKALPRKRELVYLSGVAELVCAAGLLRPQGRKWAGPASAALLVGVFPANIQQAISAQKHPSTAYRVASWVRVPLQLPLVRIALRAGRS